jgi:galactitol-specific phosphotransferase system IIC component
MRPPHHFGLPGISLPHTETINWASLMYALEKIERKIINAIVILILILYIGTSLGPLTTELARAAGFHPEGLGGAVAGYQEWSGIALGSHVVPWIVLQLFRPGTHMFWVGLGCAVVYGGAWWWVRNDILKEFASEIEAARAAKEKSEAPPP